MRLVRIDLVSPVIDCQDGSTPDPNLGFTAAPLRQPEVSRLRARISNQRPRNPERGILRRCRLDLCYREVRRIHPDLASIQKLAFPQRLNTQNVSRTSIQALAPQQLEPVICRSQRGSPRRLLRPLFRCPSLSSELFRQESWNRSETQCENSFLKRHQS